MQQEVVLGGRTVLVGLNWKVIAKAGQARKRDIKQACADSGFKFGLVIDGSEESAAIGMCAKKTDLPAAAALLAAANASSDKANSFGDSESSRNWIVVEKISGGDKAEQYWMCAIADGLPVPGTDVVDDLAVISARLAELVEIFESVNIFSVEQEILEYVAGVSPAFEKSFDELTAGVAVNKAVKPQKVIGVPDAVIAAGVVVAVGVMGVVGFNIYSEQQAAAQKKAALLRRQQMDAATRAQEAAAQSLEYQKTIANALQEAQNRVMSALAMNPDSMMRAWGKALAGLPLNHGGWQLVGARCDSAQCVITLKRDPVLGTNRGLLEVAPNALFGATDTASYIVPVKVDSNGATGMDMLPDWKKFLMDDMSLLQEARVTRILQAEFAEPLDLTYQVPPPPAPPAQPGQPPVPPAPGGAKTMGIMSGDWLLKGSNLWALEAAGEFTRGKGLSLGELEVSFAGNGDATWTARGKFFAKGLVAQNEPAAAPPAGAVSGPVQNGAMAMPPANQPLPTATAPVPNAAAR